MTATYATRRELRNQTLAVGRAWTVVSVPGNDSEPTLWFAMNRTTHRSSRAFGSYDEALLETRKRNGLAS